MKKYWKFSRVLLLWGLLANTLLARSKNDGISGAKSFLKNYLSSKNDFHFEGLVESYYDGGNHTWGHGVLTFNASGDLHFEYSPFSSKENPFIYTINISDPNSLASVYIRTLGSIYGQKDLLETLFDGMKWKISNHNSTTHIEAISAAKLPLQALRMEWDDNSKLKMVEVAINQDVFAFWVENEIP